MRYTTRGRAAARSLTFALFLLAAACGRTAEERRAIERGRETGYRGVSLPEPIPAPAFTLTDTNGDPFRFDEETAGYVTLLFFGYTHCPDICPVHLANISAILRDMLYEQSSRVKVVFVTTDPERDTLERMREWLDGFDRSFIGLTGDLDEINEIQLGLKLAPAIKIEREPGDYSVGHASLVLAFGADGWAKLVYPAGVRQADWANDIPRLVAESGPAG